MPIHSDLLQSIYKYIQTNVCLCDSGSIDLLYVCIGMESRCHFFSLLVFLYIIITITITNNLYLIIIIKICYNFSLSYHSFTMYFVWNWISDSKKRFAPRTPNHHHHPLCNVCQFQVHGNEGIKSNMYYISVQHSNSHFRPLSLSLSLSIACLPV